MPGSVSKTTDAKGKELGTEGEFCCTGGITVEGARIKCWRYYRPHGSESLRQGLMNSCNPVFIGLGQKIGVDTCFKYLNKFGLLSKTGVKLPAEGKKKECILRLESCKDIKESIKLNQMIERIDEQIEKAKRDLIKVEKNK